MKCVHGSHLYGCATQDSDIDYKGIYIPSYTDVILQRVEATRNFSTGPKDAKNSKDDVDEVYYSLHRFIDMCCAGETIAIDMLHIEDDNPNLIKGHVSPIWNFIRGNRDRFYTKNMKAFLGYVRKQASKYGIKGSRLEVMETLIRLLEGKTGKLKDHQHLIQEFCDPDGHVTVKTGFWKKDKWNDKPIIDVCGSKFDYNCPIEMIVESVKKTYDNYGHRAKLAKENKGVDFKAIHHAFRAAYQLKEIYETGDLEYPLKDAQFLLDIKLGKYHFANELQDQLETLINEVEVLASQSRYPEKVDRQFWDDFLIEVYTNP